MPTATVTPLSDLLLAVIGPTDGTTVLHNAVVVFGLTSVGTVVTVNDVEAMVAENGTFQAEIELAPGENTIKVIGRAADAEKIVTLTVTSLALPPLPLFLVVTEPTNQSIVAGSPVPLSGRTSPNAVVSVNGVSVPVNDLGIFSTTVRLDAGPNIIDVVATDATGDQLSAVVAIIFRPREG